MKLPLPALAPLLLVASLAPPARADGPNMPALSPAEISDGWQLLWDGRTTRGWRSARGPRFPTSGWQIRDGVLSTLPRGGGGDIITVAKYSDFELLVDFRMTPGANSGIKIFVDPEVNGAAGASIGLEYQILDDAANADARMGSNGNHSMGSLYDLYPPDPAKRLNPMGEWNTARIVSRGPRVEHWLNGRLILTYVRFTPDFRRRVKESKFKTWPGFGELHEGHILLQDHGDEVSFRNIKIRTLTTDTGMPAQK